MNITVFESLKKEFSVNDNGQGFCSRRAIARMTGKHRKTIQYLLDCISGGKLPHKMFELFSGITFQGGEFIPDILVSLIIQYYAFKGNETAQDYLSAFVAIGLRTVIQQTVNWESSHTKDYSTFLLKSPRVWTKVFEDDIYDDMARLTGLTWDKKTHRKPCLFAKLTFDMVYSYLPKDVYETLKQTQDQHGGYIHRIHEFLSPDGLDALKFHLTLVANTLSGCGNIYEAKKHIHQAVTKEYQLSLFTK
jgi:P63C domain